MTTTVHGYQDQEVTLVATDEQLDLEFAYTAHRDSCRDLYSPALYCRRPTGHDGEHASGFGAYRVRWDRP